MNRRVSPSARHLSALSRCLRHGARNDRGQAMVELGIVITLFMLLTLGIIEFGRILMITNVITHAARDGARAAAVTSDTSGIETRVQGLIAEVVGDAKSRDFAVTVSPNQADRTVTVTVTGEVPYLFSPFLFGSIPRLNIARSVTFSDEVAR